jgi:DNA segregation ATPase FtsK/SpoIIIE, S-DNA-T family
LARKKNEERNGIGHRHTAGGILMIALAVYLLFCEVSSSTSSGWTGWFGFYIVKMGLEKVLGFGVWLLPILLAFVGSIMLTRQEPRLLRSRMLGFIIFFLSFVSAAQIFFPGHFEAAPYAWMQGGGGAVGFLLNSVFTNVLGPIGTYILLSALLIISLIMIFNVTGIESLIEWIEGLWIFQRDDEPEKAPKKKAVNIDWPIHDKSSIPAQLDLIKDMSVKSPPVLPEKEGAVFDLPAKKEEEVVDLEQDPDRPKKKYRRHSYKLPPLSMLETLNEKEKQKALKLRELTEKRKQDLERVLQSFGVAAQVANISIGPAVTRFEVQPEPGVKVSKIANLADDIALNLASGGVRIEAPIFGKTVVGIEVPNPTVTPVRLGEIARTQDFSSNSSRLFIGIGKDIAGASIFGDLTKMPHLLIAGTTGSGKSVAINSLIISILMRARPDEVKFIMIDPKMVELATYADIPHLMAPVVTDPRKAAATLKDWVIKEMERRYKEFFNSGVRNIQAFNKKAEALAQIKNGDPEAFAPEPLPYIVVIIDELADLMMVAAAEVETTICRIAQMARATGIHLVVATQRPSVDVITGLIKANIPSRISFAVATQIDSRVVLDMSGAEKLLGRGDMLYSPIGAMKPTRVQGSYVGDDEIEKIVDFIKDQASPEYSEEILNLKYNGADKQGQGQGAGQRDELFAEAARIIIEGGQASTSHLQRRMRIGYNRAARLMDEITEAGIVSLPDGENKPRKILKNIGDLMAMGLIDTESKPEYPQF